MHDVLMFRTAAIASVAERARAVAVFATLSGHWRTRGYTSVAIPRVCESKTAEVIHEWFI